MTDRNVDLSEATQNTADCYHEDDGDCPVFAVSLVKHEYWSTCVGDRTEFLVWLD